MSIIALNLYSTRRFVLVVYNKASKVSVKNLLTFLFALSAFEKVTSGKQTTTLVFNNQGQTYNS